MELRIQEKNRQWRVDCQQDGEFQRFTVDDAESLQCRIEAQDSSTVLLRMDGRLVRARYARNGGELWVQVGARVSRFRLVDEEEDEDAAVGGANPVVKAPMPGKVLAILVEEGEQVEVGQPVVRVEAMKMEVELPAAVAGVVATIHAQAGELVLPEAPLVTITPAEDEATTGAGETD